MAYAHDAKVGSSKSRAHLWLLCPRHPYARAARLLLLAVATLNAFSTARALERQELRTSKAWVVVNCLGKAQGTWRCDSRKGYGGFVARFDLDKSA